MTEDQATHLLFQILFETKILEWLETPDQFWKNFNVCNLKLKKQVGLYDQNCGKLPKEYFEKCKNKNINKKQYERYTQKLLSENHVYENMILMLKNEKLWYKKDFKLKILK